MSESFHQPVLATEAVNLLITDRDGIYVDGTVGGGGHARLILEKLSFSRNLIGIDADPEAIAESRRTLPSDVHLFQTRFSTAPAEIRKLAPNGICGVLLDLGVSSFQLDSASRGFSYRAEAPLDLKMNPEEGESAAHLLARLSFEELTTLIRDLGEDSQARRIAKAIIAARTASPIQTTRQLAAVIMSSVPATQHKSLPRVFQALRIAVNDELGELKRGLEEFWPLLKAGGRMVVISYHSLEDRRVKHFFQELSHPPDSGHPLKPPSRPLGKLLTRKPLTPSEQELAANPRSRSAKLRAIEKLRSITV